ncbi:MAG: AAA family ATPase [Abitibacteriaceae bacterium]|nr:AAA family ATPase [Abditibacteriaceae bacterium]
MLYIFGGLPGTGKSTLAAALASHGKAVYLRVDTIEQGIRDYRLRVDGPVGYSVAYKVAAENLRLGMNVVVDSVNPLRITRDAWRDVAIHAQVAFVEIEIICSNQEEHRARVETRQTDIVGLKLPTWKDVVRREYEPWNTAHIVIDTAGQTTSQSIARLFSAVDNWINN